MRDINEASKTRRLLARSSAVIGIPTLCLGSVELGTEGYGVCQGEVVRLLAAEQVQTDKTPFRKNIFVRPMTRSANNVERMFAPRARL